MMPAKLKSKTEAKRYMDNAGRVFFVSDGIARGKSFMTCCRTASNSLQRIKSPALPVRKSQSAAQADLDAYAAKKRLVEV
jgi:hypothetical protein